MAVARAAGKKVKLDLRPAIEYLGLHKVIEQVGIDRVVEQVGSGRFTEQVGEKAVVKWLGLEGFLANLSPAERRELKRRLQ